MSKIKNIFTGIVLFSSLCSVATAAVYQWKDENGVIHYGDQPRYSDTTKIKVNTSVPVDSHMQQRNKQRKSMLKTYNDSQAEQALNEEENSSEAARKRIRCARVSKLKKSYSSATRLYSKDKSGKKTMLSAQKKQAAMQQVNTYFAKWCQ